MLSNSYIAFADKKLFANKLAIGFLSVSKSCFSTLFSISFASFLPSSSIDFVCFSKAFTKGEYVNFA